METVKKQSDKAEQVILKPVKVKFNAATCINMIPDEYHGSDTVKLRKKRFENFREFGEMMQAGTPYEMINVKCGDVLDVPGWYYEAYKDIETNVSIHIDKYRDKNGNLSPFNAADAVRHGYISDITQTMKKVKLFEKV